MRCLYDSKEKTGGAPLGFIITGATELLLATGVGNIACTQNSRHMETDLFASLCATEE